MSEPNPNREASPEAHILTMLEKRFTRSTCIFLRQVGDATGSLRTRRLDAVVIDLSFSHRVEFVGFEIKTDRCDWLCELQNPEKADVMSPSIDRFYVVAPSGVILVEEVPPAWGFIQIGDKNLLIIRGAKSLVDPSDLVARSFVAALCRANTRVSAADRARARADGAERGLAFAERAGRDLQELQAAIGTFEHASGVRIDTYRPAAIGNAVYRVLNGQEAQNGRILQQWAGTLEGLLADTREALAILVPPTKTEDKTP